MSFLVFGCGEKPQGVEQVVYDLTTPIIWLEDTEPATTEDIIVMVDEDSVLEGDLIAEWYVNNELIEFSELNLPSSYTRKGNVLDVVVYVQVTDTSCSGFGQRDDSVNCDYPDITHHRSQSVSLSAQIVNSLPLAQFYLLPTEVYTNDDIELVLTTSDPDQDVVEPTIAWRQLDSDGVVYGRVLEHTETQRDQQWEVTVELSDGDGTTQFDPILFTILDSPTILEQFEISPEFPTVQGTITSSLMSTDEDNDVIDFFYQWYVNSTLIEHAESSVEARSLNKGDLVYAKVSVDADFQNSIVSNTIQIVNSAPSIEGVVIEPDPAYSDSTIVCSAQGFSDANDDPPEYVYAWFQNGVVVSDQASIYLPDYDTTHNDLYTCSVTPFDGEAYGEEMQESIQISNTAPEIASVSYNQTTIYNNSILECVVQGTSDIDGQTDFLYEYNWYVNGSFAQSSESFDLNSSVDVADSVYCEASASDGLDYGDWVSGVELTVENRPPTASILSLSPATVYINSSLSCAILDYLDPDQHDDYSTYQWFINNALHSTGDDLELYDFSSETSVVSVGDAVRCETTAFDGYEAGPTLQATVTVENSPPVLSYATVQPSQPTSTTDLSVGVTAHDIDGEEVTFLYEWYVNGILVDVEPILDADYFSRGDQVQVYLIPVSGGVQGVGYLSSLVQINNSYPVRPVPEISPVGAREGIDDLVCSNTESVVDPDGDSVTVSYTWTVNGLATMYTIDTVNSTDIQAGDVWACTITLTDSTGASISGSSSIVVRQTNPTWTLLWDSSLYDPNGPELAFAFAESTNGQQFWHQMSTSNSVDDCWMMEGGGSSALYVPVSRSGSDLEAIEVDFYWYSNASSLQNPDQTLSVFPMSSAATGAGLRDFFGVRLYEVVVPGSTSQNTNMTLLQGAYMGAGSGSNFVETNGTITSTARNQWQTLRVEYDQGLQEVTTYLNGTLIFEHPAASEDPVDFSLLDDTYVVLRAGSSTTGFAVCWKDLIVYEGTP